ncbi:hypothetical protein D3C81_1332440 [compost metagenome]
MVIAPHCAEGMGPCEIVRLPVPFTASMRPSPSCPGAAAAGAEAAGEAVGEAPMRSAVPRRLASESIRNCPEVTTFWPAWSPSSTSTMPAASRPVLISVAMKPAVPASTMTMLRRPVRMTDSSGIISTSFCSPPSKRAVTNMPGNSCLPWLGRTMRTLMVRVAGLMSGRTVSIFPASGSVVPVGNTLTAWPAAIARAWPSGTSAITQIRLRSARRNSVVPGETVMPSRTATSVTTPSSGLTMPAWGWSLPVDSTALTCPGVMPACSMRALAALRRSGRPSAAMRDTARYSSCAATQSGEYTVTST